MILEKEREIFWDKKKEYSERRKLEESVERRKT